MKKILILLTIINSLSYSFEFEGFKSGMTMDEVISFAYINNKIIVLNKSDINRKIPKTRGYEKKNILYTKEKLFDKDKIIELYFTKKTKKLYKLVIVLNLKDKEQLNNFKKQMSLKYNEMRNPNKKIKIGLQIGSEKFWAIDRNNSYIHFKETVFSQNEVAYIDRKLMYINEKENMSIKKEIYKENNLNDIRKF